MLRCWADPISRSARSVRLFSWMAVFGTAVSFIPSRRERTANTGPLRFDGTRNETVPSRAISVRMDGEFSDSGSTI